MFGRSTSGFDRLLEKATSQLLLEPDWTSIMMLCDSIRQGDTNPRYAVAAIKKKFYHTNPHVALYALQVMESCVKNCGLLVHEEISTKQFMEELRDLVKQSTDEKIKTKVLELLQTWGMAFRNSPKYRIVPDTLNLMKAEGWKFPPLREAEAMFEADTAPEWSEGEVCHRCRVQFSTFTRQHHCRACGQVFCGKCSSKSCVLPKFGIEREVRVCDSCYAQYGPKEEAGPGPGEQQQHRTEAEQDLPAEYLASPLSKQPQVPEKAAVPGGKSEAELKEEEELQLVLALSKSEAEENDKKKGTSDMKASYSNGVGAGAAGGVATGGGAVGGGRSPAPPEPVAQDPELERYLNRDYWETRGGAAGGGVAEPVQLQQPEVVQAAVQGSPPGGPAQADTEELEEFTSTLRTQLDIFVNRMKSNSSRGRPIATDSSVQTLFMNIMTMHGKLVRYIQEQEDGRVRYEGLQDKLAQIKDARAALDALREEEAERKRAEQEEAERQRQVQLAAKLEVMRQKKAEYLEYQRQVALQRMAEQEREVSKLAEQNKAQYLQQQQGMYNMYLPYGYTQPGMPAMHAMPPQPGLMSPPHHGMMPSSTAQPGIMSPPQPGMLPPAQPGMLPPAQPGMLPPASTQPGMAAPPAQPGMAPPPAQPGTMPPHPGSFGPPSQPGVVAPPSGQSGEQGAGQQPVYQGFSMGGLSAALPQYPPQYPAPAPQPQYQAPPQQPQPEAPSASLISFD